MAEGRVYTPLVQQTKLNRAVFLDLNGTLVLPLKQESLAEMTLIPGVDFAVKRLLAAGFVCPVVTVQVRIEKGLFTEDEFRAWFADFFGKMGLELERPLRLPAQIRSSVSVRETKSVFVRSGGIGLVARSRPMLHHWR